MNTTGKYLKDENGEIFSPIVSATSVYDGDVNIKEICDAKLPLAGGTMTGTINSQNIVPKLDNTYSLGSSSSSYNTIYTTYVHLYGNYDGEKNIFYYNSGIGSYPHDVRIYGGNVESSTAIGVYDSYYSRAVCRYSDVYRRLQFMEDSVYIDSSEQSCYPGTNNAYNLGMDTKKWKTVYCKHIVTDDIYDGDYFATRGSFSGSNSYFGTSSNYAVNTYLRGDTVRIYAHTSGAVYLGSSGSTAITSDENLKDITNIDDKYYTFFNNLKPISYKYTTPSAGKRVHLGFGARQVEESLNTAGLTTLDFAGILIDKNVDIEEDEWGEEGGKHFDELYSLRYEEFIALNTAMIQKQGKLIEELKQKVEELEQKVS